MNNSYEKISEWFNDNYISFYNKYINNIQHTNNDTYQSTCPFCGNNTFNISNKTGHYICTYCTKKGSITHYYAKVSNLDDKKDYYKILTGICKDFGIEYEEVKSRITEYYDYKDDNGNLLYQVCRKEPKGFSYRRKGDNGEWIWDLKGINLVPYNLHMFDNSDTIIIVEGEKDANTLTTYGYVATTSPMGAGRWRPEYTPYFVGKKIILIPDNDIPGKEHMTKVGMSLGDITTAIQWIDLPNGVKDISDYTGNIFGDALTIKSEIDKLLSRAQKYTPIKTYSAEDVLLEFEDFNQLDLPNLKQYLNPWLTEDSITLIAGDRNVGKTWISLTIADCVTKGIPFGVWECQNSVPVMYVDGEMTPKHIQTMYNKISKDIDRKEPLYIYSDYLANRKGLVRLNLLHETGRDMLMKLVNNKRIKLLILDNLSSLTPGIDENDKKAWDEINQWLIKLRFAGVSTILLHHTNKTGGQRGTSAREDNIDNSISLRFPPDYSADQGVRMQFKFTKNRAMTDHNLLADNILNLNTFQDKYNWEITNNRQDVRKEILKLMSDGNKQSDIVEILGLSKGYVSKIMTSLKENSLIDKNNNISDSGLRIINDQF